MSKYSEREYDGWNKNAQSYPVAMAKRRKPTKPMPLLTSHPWGRALVEHEEANKRIISAPVPEHLL